MPASDYPDPVPERIPAGIMSAARRRPPRFPAAEVLLRDGSWQSCTVVAWARNQAGWAALVRWPGGREDWLQYHSRHIRPA